MGKTGLFDFAFHLLRLLDELTLVALDVVGLIKLLTRFDVFDAMPLRLFRRDVARPPFKL